MKLFAKWITSLHPGSLVFPAAILISFLLIPISGAAQQDSNSNFEGVIEYRVPSNTYSKNQTQQFKYMAKGNQGRIEFEMQGNRPMALLVTSKQNTITLLMPRAQTYMEFPMDNQESASNSSGKEPKLQRLDKTRVIAGRKCQLWQVKEKNKTVNICVAHGMGNFLLPGAKIPGRMGPLQMENRPDWLNEAVRKGFMPLELTVTENNKTRTVLKAQKIVEKSLPSSLFTVPSDYQNMNQMMRQMMQGEKEGK